MPPSDATSHPRPVYFVDELPKAVSGRCAAPTCANVCVDTAVEEGRRVARRVSAVSLG